MSRIKTTVTVVLVALLSGCGYNINPYGASVENVQAIQAASGKPMAVAEFTSSRPGLKSIGCRAAGPVEAPNDASFEAYIQKAFVDELTLARVYDAASSLIIRANLDKIDFNSNIGAGKWVLALTISTSSNPGYQVESIHEFSTNWVADKACQQVAQAFGPAVQQLIRTVVTDPRFKELVR